MADQKYTFKQYAVASLGAGLAAALVGGAAALGNGKFDTGDIGTVIAAFFSGLALFIQKNPFESE